MLFREELRKAAADLEDAAHFHEKGMTADACERLWLSWTALGHALEAVRPMACDAAGIKAARFVLRSLMRLEKL